MKRLISAAAIALASAGAVFAQGATVHPFDGTFDDATFAVESAIVGRGLVIDYVSRTGDMLARTATDVGSNEHLFDGADIFMFCSAVLSRKMMEIDPMNIAYCPYGIFVTDRDGMVAVGYRNQPEGEMQEVQALLESIVLEAVGN